MFYLISLFSLLFCFSVFISDYFLFLIFIFFSIPLLAVSKRLPLIVPQHIHTYTHENPTHRLAQKCSFRAQCQYSSFVFVFHLLSLPLSVFSTCLSSAPSCVSHHLLCLASLNRSWCFLTPYIPSFVLQCVFVCVCVCVCVWSSQYWCWWSTVEILWNSLHQDML